MSLRRYYHYYFRHHPRFLVTVLLTIFAVGYIGVPQVLHLVDSVAKYDPRGYEPRDRARGEWLERQDPELDELAWDDLLKVGVLILVGVAWLTVIPSRGGRRRPPSR